MSALLEVDQLEVSFGGRVSAVRGASVTVERGETHCLVGESGCGKSVTALAVMNLLARGARRSAKRLAFEGQDLTGLSDAGMAHLRGNAMVRRDEPLGSIPGTVPRIGPGFEGCAFRERCDFADATCAHTVPRHAASAAHDFLCRLPA